MTGRFEAAVDSSPAVDVRVIAGTWSCSTMPGGIVSLLSSATEMLCGLGLANRVAAISHECDYPPEILDRPRATFSWIDSAASSDEIDRQVRSRLAAGDALHGIDEELVARLRPELIVTQAQCDVCAVRFDDVAQLTRRRVELRETRIVSLAPLSLEDVLGDVLRLAVAAGVGDRGIEYAGRLRRRIEAVAAQSCGIAEQDRPRVMVVEWIEPLMLAGNWTPELVRLAGGRCMPAAGEHSRYCNWDAARAYAAEVIVVAPCGFDERRANAEAPRLRDFPGWCELPAVRNGRVHVVDGSALLNRSGPRLIESLELLRKFVAACME
jgi:iron complex transport system substrate-binding protein